jgi:CubicO group peptidase (beta-lactamase class C family)
VRHLLSHTAGLVDLYEAAESVDALLAKLADTPRIAAPGRVFSYSNPGFVLLGRIVEELSGRSWGENVATRLLAPLRLETTALVPGPASPVAPGYGLDPATGQLRPAALWPDIGHTMDAAGSSLHGTAGDAARLARAIGTGEADGTRLLSPDMVRRMLAPQIELPGSGLIARAWCLGWSLFADGAGGPVHGHIGGTSAIVALQAPRARACAVLTNFSGGARIGRDVLRELFELPFAEDPWPGGAPAPDAAKLASYAGRYGGVVFTVDVRVNDGRLEMTDPLSNAYRPLAHLRDDTFLLDIGEVLTEVSFAAASDARPANVHIALRTLARLPGA